MNEDLLQDPSWNGPLMIALQQSITEAFTKSDWNQVGHLTGMHAYIINHNRLLRSMDWGDDDYGDCVFDFLNCLQQRNPQALARLVEHQKIMPALEGSVPHLLNQLGISVGHVPAVAPSESASDVVRRALNDANQLIVTNGAQSAVDRLHTAIHGYLKAECEASGIALPQGATVTQAFKALRSDHPALSTLGAYGAEVGKVLQSFASVLDALNLVRNHGSVAHPNANLIEAPEAFLFVNAVRTVFHYLNHKLGH
ncbi:abortive infection family protein [Pseudomonas aeruginosa]|uniref:abortive infection family protein n=1 Tax=Pseudomonas aeruginosa TaxID=287 RepID=UPI0029008693|nr:abortive infection family protein [Pseudomonas aeruginosa]MDU0701896.1 abortive infection family protein [Pseudomonas aeruginosa]